METKDLKTLKSLLEPLLNLTAHCTPNKIDFCKVEGMLDFLISKLRSTTNTSLSSSVSSSASQLSPTELAIVENSGGILRNISSYLVTREDLIEKLRSQNIVAIRIPSSLQMRKLKAFRTEIHSFLSENFDTLQCDASPNGSPSHCSLHNRNPNSKAFNLSKCKQ